MSLTLSPAPRPLPPSGPPAIPAGTWRMRAFALGGEVTTPAAEVVWAVDGDGVEVRHAGVVQRPPGATGCALVAAGGAGGVDFVVRFESGDPQTLPGVFAVDGDALTLCLALRGDRPGGCEAGPDRVVYTFERVPDAACDPSRG